MMKEHIVNVQIPVSSESTIQIPLAAFLSRFSTESRGGLQNQLMIEIPKLSTVFNEIRTEDNQIGLGNFALGNCPNPGLFFVRGNYSTKVNSMPSNTKLWTGNLDKNARIEKPFGTLNLLSYVHFEHDQKHISIKFVIPLSKPDEDCLAFRGFKMNLQYSAIQSITVDSGQKNLNRKSRSIDFLFRLKHPPSLYEVQPTTMADQKRIINLQKEFGRFPNYLPYSMKSGQKIIKLDWIILPLGIVPIPVSSSLEETTSLKSTTCHQIQSYRNYVSLIVSESTVQIALAAFLSRFSTESRGGLQNQLMIEIPKLSTVFNEIRTEDNQIGLDNFALGNCPNPGLFFVRGNYFTKVNNMPSNTKLSKPLHGSFPSLLFFIHDGSFY
ncbi:hypothetical protein PRIPAC_72585 [Pristionchus pacificus]|uniref:PH-like domain-containing protein n=1 Tax=Pristionchus pacificus TaxID=54126 RepID=A0A2A6BGA2_PRIPA|nr:hypothetical protein PRIPAC_72585 [Pristionchus pacificus]|eukprot:PDM64831.1 hypothetical protein PRIPAC_53087 [Pristionchus pacificus]